MGEGADPLAELRRAINQVDNELLEQLNRRARLVEQVAEHKRGASTPFYVPNREREIIDRLQQASDGPFPKAALRPVFQEIISACLSLEQGVRVAYLGPEATYTHQAVKRHFGTSARAMPCATIHAVFDEVVREQADFAVVPVENSSEGVVSHTLDSFIDSSLTIVAEILVNIDHALVTAPGVAEIDIERVYSHPQALGQCRNWLQANLPKATLVECSSTSAAARRARSDAAGAAIAAELAARIYGLDVKREKLQDVQHNVTRFLVIGQGTQSRAAGADDYKTSVLLVLPDTAGALFQVLQPLSEAGINLTKIESRPSRLQAWDYVFFLDLDGHRDDPEVASALAQLDTICQLCKVLGSYRKADEI